MELNRRLATRYFFTLVVILISGCGTTGTTTRVKVNLEGLPKATQMRQTGLESVMVETEGTGLATAGMVHAWGSFEENDRLNIAESIKDALAAAKRGNQVVVDDPIRIHVLIRKYLLRTSTSFVAIFSAVDWVAITSRKDLLFQDTFYTTEYCEVPKICTLGSVKDDVNRAIVERISKRAIMLASGRDPTPIVPERTYATYEEAAATMRVGPRGLVSSLLFGVRPGNDAQQLSWIESARLPAQTDWTRRLGNATQ